MTATKPKPQDRTKDDRPQPANTCRLILTITSGGKSTDYRVSPIDPGFAGTRAFRLKKVLPPGSDVDEVHSSYDVVQTIDEIACGCPDWIFRKEGLGKMCRHGAALVALGLLDDFDRPVSQAPKPR